MTNVSQIKRELKMLQHVLTPKENKGSDDLNQLLKRYEQLGLTASQEHEIVKEVVKDLVEEGLI